MGDKEGEGKGMGCSPEGEPCWVLCLEAFILLLQAGILGEASGDECFSRTFISSPGAPFWGRGLHRLVSDSSGDP